MTDQTHGTTEKSPKTLEKLAVTTRKIENARGNVPYNTEESENDGQPRLVRRPEKIHGKHLGPSPDVNAERLP
jgi:hypothetical protein